MMGTQTQWEYCRLSIADAKQHVKGGILGIGGEVQGFGYNSSLTYYSISGETITEKLTTNTEPTNLRPFSTAMGLLGAGGWELVSIQHGNLAATSKGTTPDTTLYWDTISWNCVVAYFKRLVVAGRAVNEPQVRLRK